MSKQNNKIPLTFLRKVLFNRNKPKTVSKVVPEKRKPQSTAKSILGKRSVDEISRSNILEPNG